MIYSILYCSNSGSFGDITDCEIVHSKAEIKYALEYWANQHSLAGTNPNQAYLLVFKGKLQDNDSTDYYPDFQAFLGKRGGLTLSPC